MSQFFVGWLVCREFVADSLLFFQLVVPRSCYLVVANLLFQTIQKCSIVDTVRMQFACLSADVSVFIRVCVTSTQVSHRTAPVSRCSLADDRIQNIKASRYLGEVWYILIPSGSTKMIVWNIQKKMPSILPIPWYCDGLSPLSFGDPFHSQPGLWVRASDAWKGRNGRLRHERERAFKAGSAHVTGLIFICSDVLSGGGSTPVRVVGGKQGHERSLLAPQNWHGKYGKWMNIRPLPRTALFWEFRRWFHVGWQHLLIPCATRVAASATARTSTVWCCFRGTWLIYLLSNRQNGEVPLPKCSDSSKAPSNNLGKSAFDFECFCFLLWILWWITGAPNLICMHFDQGFTLQCLTTGRGNGTRLPGIHSNVQNCPTRNLQFPKMSTKSKSLVRCG